jgi:hypothetical protein
MTGQREWRARAARTARAGVFYRRAPFFGQYCVRRLSDIVRTQNDALNLELTRERSGHFRDTAKAFTGELNTPALGAARVVMLPSLSEGGEI